MVEPQFSKLMARVRFPSSPLKSPSPVEEASGLSSRHGLGIGEPEVGSEYLVVDTLGRHSGFERL